MFDKSFPQSPPKTGGASGYFHFHSIYVRRVVFPSACILTFRVLLFVPNRVNLVFDKFKARLIEPFFSVFSVWKNI